MKNQTDDVVVTSIGCVTKGAYGLAAHWQLAREGTVRTTAESYSLADFKAAPYLSDRRMLKAVSAADAIGLAAIEGAKKEFNAPSATYAPERIGLYVGAPPASAFDNAFYADAMDASRDADGRASIKAFGKTSMSAMPMTLLVGLPNNVLCYGSMIFDAKGPNSNYTSTATAGHIALINGAKRVARGQLDVAVAGGFNAHTEPVNSRMYQALKVTTALADGAAFATLERRSAAEARGQAVIATYLGGAMASDGRGPIMMDEGGSALEGAIHRALAEAGLTPHDIGLVLASAAGYPPADACEFSVLSRVFAREREFPALGNSSRVAGDLMEAGGLLEIGFAARIFVEGEVPAALRPAGHAADSRFGTKVDPLKQHALILRTSPWGEYSVVVIRA